MYTVTSRTGWDNRVYTVARHRQTSRVGQSRGLCCGKPRADIKGMITVCTPWQVAKCGIIVCTVLWLAADRHQWWDNRVYTAASCK